MEGFPQQQLSMQAWISSCGGLAKSRGTTESELWLYECIYFAFTLITHTVLHLNPCRVILPLHVVHLSGAFSTADGEKKLQFFWQKLRLAHDSFVVIQSGRCMLLEPNSHLQRAFLYLKTAIDSTDQPSFKRHKYVVKSVRHGKTYAHRCVQWRKKYDTHNCIHMCSHTLLI